MVVGRLTLISVLCMFGRWGGHSGPRGGNNSNFDFWKYIIKYCVIIDQSPRNRVAKKWSRYLQQLKSYVPLCMGNFGWSAPENSGSGLWNVFKEKLFSFGFEVARILPLLGLIAEGMNLDMTAWKYCISLNWLHNSALFSKMWSKIKRVKGLKNSIPIKLSEKALLREGDHYYFS